MRNQILSGNVLTVTAAGDVSSGDLVEYGSGIFVVAETSAVAGSEFEGVTGGVFSFPKSTTEGALKGAVAYFDNSIAGVTADDNSGANKVVGVFHATAGAAAETAEVLLVSAVQP